MTRAVGNTTNMEASALVGRSALAALVERHPDAVYVADADGHVLFANARARELFGLRAGMPTKAGLVGLPVGDENRPSEITLFVDGEPRVAELLVTSIDWAGREATLGAIRDVTHLRAEEHDRRREAVAARERFFADILDALTVRVAILAADGTVLACNATWETSPGDVEPQSVNVGDDLVAALRREPAGWGGRAMEAAELVEAVVAGERHRGEFEFYEDRRWWLARATAVAAQEGGAVVEHIDVTARKRAERRLADQALRDPLTGLANRILLRDRLAHALAAAGRDGDPVAVLYCDLDGFKTVNDQLGHDAGDILLRHVAGRLQEAVRGADTVSRPGGDEFVVVAPATSDPEAEHLADRIIRTLSEPVRLQGVEVNVGVSIGIAAMRTPSADPTELLRDADTALYRAKRLGRGRWVRFRPDMGRVATDRARTEQLLRRALHNGWVATHLQPQWPLSRTGRLTAFEALVRLETPDDGIVAAGVFIDVAEETGLVRQLGEVVLRQACAHARRLASELDRSVRVWVNLSTPQLAHATVAPALLQVLEDEQVAPEWLGVEITERTAITDPVRTQASLRQLRDAGIHVALDDFGAGYATFHALRDLPLDCLKIDRSFVTDIAGHTYDRAVVAAVQQLADTLGVETIAEGVELPEQLEALMELGCQHAQGYLLGRPGSIDDVLATIRSGRAHERLTAARS